MTGQATELLPVHELLAERQPAALEHLYHYAPRLEQALLRRFGSVIPVEDVKDIVRDALIRAFLTGDRFDPRRAKLSTWLNQLAHYQALEFLRHNQPASSLDSPLRSMPADIPTADSGDQRPSPYIQQILQRLPPRRARVLLLYYYERYSCAEIARKLQITQAAVRSHLSHARSDLRTELTRLQGQR